MGTAVGMDLGTMLCLGVLLGLAAGLDVEGSPPADQSQPEEDSSFPAGKTLEEVLLDAG
jgi:hypothetical protein